MSHDFQRLLAAAEALAACAHPDGGYVVTGSWSLCTRCGAMKNPISHKWGRAPLAQAVCDAARGGFPCETCGGTGRRPSIGGDCIVCEGSGVSRGH